MIQGICFRPHRLAPPGVVLGVDAGACIRCIRYVRSMMAQVTECWTTRHLAGNCSLFSVQRSWWCIEGLSRPNNLPTPVQKTAAYSCHEVGVALYSKTQIRRTKRLRLVSSQHNQVPHSPTSTEVSQFLITPSVNHVPIRNPSPSSTCLGLSSLHPTSPAFTTRS